MAQHRAVVKNNNPPKPTKLLRFTWADEDTLGKEVVSENPIADPLKWDVVRQNVNLATGKLFVVKTLKQHLDQMIEKRKIKVQ